MIACVGLAFGQGKEVTGTVTDATSGFPLPGVNIVVQGTTTGTTTSIDGEYSIQVPGNDAVLLFSFIGYEMQEVIVGDRTTIDVELQEDVALLEDIVVVGYGTQRKEDVTGSVATVDISEANQGLVTSPDQMISGRVAGVSAVSNNGEPGAGLKIRIRGGTSISASNDPLYVIDGVPIDNSGVVPGGEGIDGSAPPARNPLSLINPNDVESISILKDASATAIYGSRGANGVVLITTKKGQEGRVTVDYEAYVTGAVIANELGLASASEYRTLAQEAVANCLVGCDEDNNIVDENGNGTADFLDGLGSANTDWENEITQTGVSHFHNLAFAGGTANTRYRASVSYLDQEGVIISSGQERITGRINADNTAFDGRLRLSLNVSTAFTEDDYLPYNETAGFEGGVFNNVYSFNPTQPVRTANGNFYEIGAGAQSVRNPVALAEQIDDFSKTTRALGNLAAELDLTSELTAKVSLGADRSQARRSQYFPGSSPAGATFNGRAIQQNAERTSVTFQSYLTYNDIVADVHTFDLLGGYEFNEYFYEIFGAEARDFVTDVTSFNALQAGNAQDNFNFANKEINRLISFFTRANYNYASKYYLTGVLRYDGSSRFGENNRWALFPAVSGAWRISEEGFMQDNDLISDLRLKAGWGITGSQEIQNLLTKSLLGFDSAFRAVLGGRVFTGVAQSQVPNPDLKWEETSSINVGLDFAFANGKYSGTIEWYQKNTDDLLLEVPIPGVTVVTSRIENIGEVENMGLEANLDALVIDGVDRSLSVGVVFSTNKNEVIRTARGRIPTGSVSGRGQSDLNAQVIDEGLPIGTFFGFEFAFVCTPDRVSAGDCTQDDAGRQFFNEYEPRSGDDPYERTQQIGFTTDPGENDRQILGNAQPDFNYGIRSSMRFGAFDASIFLRGEVGRDVFNNTALVYQTKSALLQNANFLADALDDPDAINEPAKFSSRWIEDGSYLRLDNVTLGYTLDLNSLTSYARNARIYVSLQNLFVLTGYSGYDPEVNTNAGLATLGIDYTNYPRPRTFTLGVNLGF